MLTSNDKSRQLGHQSNIVADGMQATLGRLLRLVCADYIQAVEIDTLTKRCRVIGAAGDDNRCTAIPGGPLGFPGILAAIGWPGLKEGVNLDVSRLASGGDGVESLFMTIRSSSNAFVVLIASRRPPRPRFGVTEERAVRRAAGWTGDYLRLWCRLQQDLMISDGLRAALEPMGTGVLIQDARGELIAVNHIARTMLDAGDGLRLLGGMLTAAVLEDSVRLQTAIAHVRAQVKARADGTEHTVPQLSIRRRGRRPLSVAVVSGSDSEVIVHVVDPEIDLEQSIAPLCVMYGLTGAEARLIKLLVQGASLTEAASRLRIQAPTARTYLKQAFAKTGTKRQATLIQLMLNSTVRMVPGVALTALR